MPTAAARPANTRSAAGKREWGGEAIRLRRHWFRDDHDRRYRDDFGSRVGWGQLLGFGKEELGDVLAGRQDDLYPMGSAFSLIILAETPAETVGFDADDRVALLIEIGRDGRALRRRCCTLLPGRIDPQSTSCRHS